MIVYKATNKINQKVYIGQTTIPLSKRINSHKYEASKKSNKMIFHSAIRKYGIECFQQDVIYTCHSKEELNDMEAHYIQQYDSTNGKFGYNILCGDGCYKRGALNPSFRKKSDYCGELHWMNKLGEKGKREWIDSHLSGVNSVQYGKKHDQTSVQKISNIRITMGLAKGANNPNAKTYTIIHEDNIYNITGNLKRLLKYICIPYYNVHSSLASGEIVVYGDSTIIPQFCEGSTVVTEKILSELECKFNSDLSHKHRDKIKEKDDLVLSLIQQGMTAKMISQLTGIPKTQVDHSRRRLKRNERLTNIASTM